MFGNPLPVVAFLEYINKLSLIQFELTNPGIRVYWAENKF